MARINLFYPICFGVIAIFLPTVMSVSSQTLSPTIREWRNEEPTNGTNPGLAFIPVPDHNESTLIWSKGRINYREFQTNIMAFLDIYYNQQKNKRENGNVTSIICSYNELPKQGQVCAVDTSNWEPCTREFYFGYHHSAPCIFLKLHKINGWVPEYYNDPNDLPEDMPHQLQDHIRNIKRPEERNNVWVTCAGEHPVDIEYLGPVEYHPFQGFPGYYFPYTNSEGYLSPLVAVHFKRASFGVVVNIECRAWAKNIEYNRQNRSGSVHLELLLE